MLSRRAIFRGTQSLLRSCQQPRAPLHNAGSSSRQPNLLMTRLPALTARSRHSVTSRFHTRTFMTSKSVFDSKPAPLPSPPASPSSAAHPPPTTDSSSPDTPESKPQPRPGLLSRIFLKVEDGSATSFGKIVALAKPERKPLTQAIGLLMISSGVSMSVPFTIGKLIDFFSSSNPSIPLGLSLGQAGAGLMLLFTIGAAANAGRSLLMRMSGEETRRTE